MKQTVYRIYTERRGTWDDRTIREVGKRFSAFTIIRAQGYWEGKAEPAMIIEIITGMDGDAARVFELAEYLRVMNEQDAVLVTQHDVTTIMADGD